jgi:hypothetical protein
MAEPLVEAAIDEIDGVRFVHVNRPGPTRLSLMFRGGMADETLPTRGLAHLAEHLTLHRLFHGDIHHNGYVDGLTTVFFTTGTPDDARAFLDHVVEARTGKKGDRAVTRLDELVPDDLHFPLEPGIRW